MPFKSHDEQSNRWTKIVKLFFSKLQIGKIYSKILFLGRNIKRFYIYHSLAFSLRRVPAIRNFFAIKCDFWYIFSSFKSHHPFAKCYTTVKKKMWKIKTKRETDIKTRKAFANNSPMKLNLCSFTQTFLVLCTVKGYSKKCLWLLLVRNTRFMSLKFFLPNSFVCGEFCQEIWHEIV